MAACGRRNKLEFDDDDEKLDVIMAKMRKNMTNRPVSSKGKIVRVMRSKVKGRFIADEDTRRVPGSPRKRDTARKDLALSYYLSMAGDHPGFHLRDDLIGVTRVEFNRGKISMKPVKFEADLKSRPKPVIIWEKNPEQIPESWFKSARPRSPYVVGGILYAELKGDSPTGFCKRAHPVPKKYGLTNITSTFGFKNEEALLKESIKQKKIIEYRNPKHQDVWVGGTNLFGKGFQHWGLRIGNNWIIQEGEGKTNIVKKPSRQQKHVMWKRIGTTTVDVNWLVKEFNQAYAAEFPNYHEAQHNCIHISAAVAVVCGLEVPFWPAAETCAKLNLTNLAFANTPAAFIATKAVRIFIPKPPRGY